MHLWRPSEPTCKRSWAMQGHPKSVQVTTTRMYAPPPSHTHIYMQDALKTELDASEQRIAHAHQQLTRRTAEFEEQEELVQTFGKAFEVRSRGGGGGGGSGGALTLQC